MGSEYQREFEASLRTVVRVVLRPPTADIETMTDQLYPPELQRAASNVGEQLQIPVNTAVTFLVLTHSRSIQTKSAFSSLGKRILSKRARDAYRNHAQILKGVSGLSAHWDELLYPLFMEAFMHEFLWVQCANVPSARLKELRAEMGQPPMPAKLKETFDPLQSRPPQQ